MNISHVSFMACLGYVMAYMLNKSGKGMQSLKRPCSLWFSHNPNLNPVLNPECHTELEERRF